MAGQGAREGCLRAEASGVRSGREFCSEPEAGWGCFLAVAFVFWVEKEVGKVELGFGDSVCWKLSLCKAGASRLLRRMSTLEAEGKWEACVQKPLPLSRTHTHSSLSPSSQTSPSPGLVRCLVW